MFATLIRKHVGVVMFVKYILILYIYMLMTNSELIPDRSGHNDLLLFQYDNNDHSYEFSSFSTF